MYTVSCSLDENSIVMQSKTIDCLKCGITIKCPDHPYIQHCPLLNTINILFHTEWLQYFWKQLETGLSTLTRTKHHSPNPTRNVCKWAQVSLFSFIYFLCIIYNHTGWSNDLSEKWTASCSAFNILIFVTVHQVLWIIHA